MIALDWQDSEEHRKDYFLEDYLFNIRLKNKRPESCV